MAVDNPVFHFERYLLLAEDFAQKLQLLANNNKVRRKAVSVLLGEWDEVEEAYRRAGSFCHDFPVRSELADYTFGLALYTVLHLPSDFNFERAERLVGNQHKDPRIFDKVRRQTRLLERSDNAADSMLVILASLSSIANALPAVVRPVLTFTEQVEHTRIKNFFNYPELLFSGKEPVTQKYLPSDVWQLAYDHRWKGMRGIRDAAGKPRDGVKPHQWQPFIQPLLAYEQSDRALHQLRKEVARARDNGFFENNRVRQ